MKRLIVLWIVVFLASLSFAYAQCCVITTGNSITYGDIEDGYYSQELCSELGGIIETNSCSILRTQPGCCCTSSTTEDLFNRNECAQQQGVFAPKTQESCQSICEVPVEEPQPTQTCAQAGGIKCAWQGVGNLITGTFNDIDWGFGCYSVPCNPIQDISCTQDYGYEAFCHDGLDNSCNNKVDAQDDQCQSSISGTVTDMNGNPLVFTIVESVKTNGDRAIAFTDNEGKYTLSFIARGNHTVRVLSSIHSFEAQQVEIDDFDVQKKDIDFSVALTNVGRIIGTVRSEDESLSDASVYIRPRRAITGSDGTYTMDNIPADTYDIFASKQGYLTQQKTVTVQDARNATVNFDLVSSVCDSIDIHLVHHRPVRGKAQIRLEWDTDGCPAQEYTILRCEGESCELSPIDTTTNTTYIDTTVNWEQTYTYKIQTIMFTQPFESSPVSVYVGDRECEDRFTSEPFCLGSHDTQAYVASCNTENIVDDVACGDSQICFEFSDAQQTDARCADKPRCVGQESAWPLGLFYNTDNCGSLCYMDAYDFTFDKEGRHISRHEQFLGTITPFCIDCKTNMQCYDYKSEQACEQNRCSIQGQETSNPCAWQVTNEHLGTGVCVDKTKDQCEMCGKISINAQGVTFRQCTEAECDALGNNCYFTGNACVSTQTGTCYDYKDPDKCTSASFAINPFDNTYSNQNEVGLSNCLWLNNGCVRDAQSKVKDDCANAGAESNACKADRTPPQTGLVVPNIIYPDVQPFSMIFSFFDDNMRDLPQAPGEIFVCIGVDSDACGDVQYFAQVIWNQDTRQHAIFVDNTTFLVGTTPYEFVPGNNTIRYYGKDRWGNVEIVNERVVFFDTLPPQIDITYQTIEDPTSRTIDVAVNVQTNKISTCTIDINPQTYDDAQDFSQTYSLTHFRLATGRYAGIHLIEVTCKDFYGNNQTKYQQISLAQNDDIQRIAPPIVTDTSTVTLEVQTPIAVTCRYTKDYTSSSSPMQRTQQETGYRHTAQVQNLQNGLHTYYIVCDYEQSLPYVLSFVVDTQAPTVSLTTSQGTSLSQGIRDGTVQVQCVDTPQAGFGCNQTLYCLSYEGACIPDRVVQNNIITVEHQGTLCVRAQENIRFNQGGRFSEVVCEQVVLDSYNPILVVDVPPTSTRSNSITIPMRVFSPSYVKDKWTLSGFSYIEEVAIGQDIDWTFIQVGDIRHGFRAEYQFRRTSPTQYYALEIDTTQAQPMVRIMQRDGSSVTTLDSKTVALSPEPLSIRISAHAQQADVFITQAQRTYTLSSNQVTARTGVIGVRQVPQAVIVPIEIKDIMFVNNQKDKVYNIYLERENNNIPQFIGNTYYELDYTLPLTQGTLRHGDSFSFSLYAMSQLQRQSQKVSFTTYYDVVGPSIDNIRIRGLSDNETDYVEHHQQGVLQVDIEDDYSQVASAYALLYDRNITLTKQNTSWQADFIADIPIGRHDVTIVAYDSVGNRNEKTFEKTMVVDDVLQRNIRLLFQDPLYTGDQTPTLRIHTAQRATCALQYTDSNNNNHEEIFTYNELNNNHVLTLNYPLPLVENRQQPNDALIVCTYEEGHEVQRLIEIIVDKRPPVFGLRANDDMLILQNITRTHRTYIDVMAMDRVLVVRADKPVVCRFDNELGKLHEDMRFTLGSVQYQTTQRSQSLPIQTGEQTYEVSCVDIAGNKAVDNRRVTINRVINYPLHVENIYPKGNISSQEVTFSFDVIRPKSCQIRLGNNDIAVSRIGKTYQSIPQVLANGDYTYTIICGDEQKSIDFSINAVPPQVDITLIEQDGPLKTYRVNASRPIKVSIYNEHKNMQTYDFSTSHIISVPLSMGENLVLFDVVDTYQNRVLQEKRILYEQQTPLFLLGNVIETITDKKEAFYFLLLFDQDVFNVDVVVQGKDGIVQGTLERNNDGSYIYKLPNMQEGLHHVSIYAYDSTGQLIGYTSTVFTIDNFSDSIDIFDVDIIDNNQNNNANNNETINNATIPQIVNEFRYETQVTALIDYKNIITQTQAQQRYDTFTQAKQMVPGINILSMEAQNELGALLRSQTSLLYGGLAPTIRIEVEGHNQRTHVANPSFTVTASKPATLRYAVLYEQGNEAIEIPLQAYDTQNVFVQKMLHVDGLLENGKRYTLELQVEDVFGYLSDSISYTFLYQREQVAIQLIEPSHGWSATQQTNFTVRTDRQVSCRYDTVNQPYEGMIPMQRDGFFHTAPVTVSSQEQVYYVKCKDTHGGINEESPAEFMLVHNQYIPQINTVDIFPGVNNVVIEYPLRTNLRIQTDMQTMCAIHGSQLANQESREFSQNHSFLLRDLQDNQQYNVTIVCESKSGIQTQAYNYTFSVDLSSTLSDIRVQSPQNIVFSHTFGVELLLSQQTDRCVWGWNQHNKPYRLHKQSTFRYIDNSARVDEDGQYTIYIECIGSAGRVYTTQKTFEVRTIPPQCSVDLFSFSNVSGSLNRLSLGFHQNVQADSIEYALGTAPHGQEGWNSILPVSLARGTPTLTYTNLSLINQRQYYWNVRFNAGVFSEWCTTDAITIDTSKIITLKNPQYGWSTERMVNFTVETPRTMQCAYDTVNKPFDQMIPFTWSDGFTHSGMAQLYENPIDYFVKCKEANTVINEPNPAVFSLKYDTSKPRISGISLSPGIQNKVVERPLQTTLSLDTDIDARCEYMLNNVTHAFDTGFTQKHTVFIENLQDKTTYDLSISCYSRALVKSDISRYSIIVDTAQRGDITFSSPQAFVSNKTFTLALQTQQDTQWCRWSFSQSQINNDMQRVSARQYSENITVQQDGTYTIYVSCVGSDARILRGQKTVNVYTQPVTCEDVTVVVPQTSPFRDRIPVEVYTNKTLQHIQAIVGTARYPQAGWNMSDIQNISNYESFSITGLNLSLEQTYYVNYRLQAATLSEWCVSNGTKVMTNASIPSSPTSIVSIVMEKTRYTSQDTIRALVNFSSTQALSVPYHYYINNKRHEGRTLNLSGTVQEQIELGTLQEGNYELKIVLGQHERIQNFRVDCTSGIDCFCDRNNCEDNQSIIPGTCTDGIKNGLETDVDCGGPDCLGCELTKQCQIHSDCRSGNCQAGICVAQTRTPDIQEESSSLLWMLLILLLIVLALAGGGLYYYTQIYQKKTQIKSSSSKSSTTLPPLGSTNKQAPAPIAPPKSAKQKLKEALQKKLKAHVDDKVKQDHSKVFSAFSEDKDKPQKDIKDNNKNIDNNDKIKNKTIDDKINDAKTQIIHKKEDRNVVDPKSKKEESMSDMDKLKSINTGSNIDAIRSIIQKNKKAKDSLEKLKALNTGKKDE